MVNQYQTDARSFHSRIFHLPNISFILSLIAGILHVHPFIIMLSTLLGDIPD